MSIEKFGIGHFDLMPEQQEELETLQGKGSLSPSEKERLEELIEKKEKMEKASGRVADKKGEEARESLQETLDQFEK